MNNQLTQISYQAPVVRENTEYKTAQLNIKNERGYLKYKVTSMP